MTRRLIVAVALACSSIALAQDPPSLGGPRVKADELGTAPLIQHGFDGRVRRLEMPIEEAAVEQLGLDTPASERITAVINARKAILDKFIEQNLDLLTRFGTASGAGDKLDQYRLGLQALDKLHRAGFYDGGTLFARVYRALPEDKRPTFQQIVKSYYDAIVKEEQRPPTPAPANTDKGGAGSEPTMTGGSGMTGGQLGLGMSLGGGGAKGDAAGEGKPKSRNDIVNGERMASFGREIEHAFQRQVNSGDIVYAYIANGLDLNPDQQTKVRQLCAKYVEETKLEPTKMQGAKFALSVSAVLDPDQKVKFWKRIKGQSK